MTTDKDLGNGAEFDKWFKKEGISPEHREMMRVCWDACLDVSCDLFEEYEGYDYELRTDLRA